MNVKLKSKNIKMRSDLTHKYNQNLGRHGWLRLTPAYSLKLVRELLNNNNDKNNILDPFAGTSTTVLSASYSNIDATAIEINPFLVWLGKVKSDIYSNEEINESLVIANKIIDNITNGHSKISLPPPISNIDRWWDNKTLNYLCKLMGEIENKTYSSERIKNLLLITFCNLMIKTSNASFNHQSMSFKKQDTKLKQSMLQSTDDSFSNQYFAHLNYILKSASRNPIKSPNIIEGDSKYIDKLTLNKFDLIITSPPYPNRMSYIRELRPYMFWLGFLKKARESGELDWKTIGGTWGIATSRLNEWKQSNDEYFPDYFENILKKISDNKNGNGVILANYIRKYFSDIWIHLQNLSKVMESNGKFHYIVGNSTFYNVLLPVEKIYKDMFDKLGFEDVAVKTIRKRGSKKELYEFDVSGLKT